MEPPATPSTRPSSSALPAPWAPRASGSPSSPNSGPIGAAAGAGLEAGRRCRPLRPPVTDRHQHGPRLRPMIAPDWSVPGVATWSARGDEPGFVGDHNHSLGPVVGIQFPSAERLTWVFWPWRPRCAGARRSRRSTSSGGHLGQHFAAPGPRAIRAVCAKDVLRARVVRRIRGSGGG